MKQHTRDLLLAWSTVNLLFFRRWAQILPGGHDYFLEHARPPTQYLALMVLIVLAALAAWGAFLLARRSRRTWPLPFVRAVFLVAAALGLRSIIAEGWVYLGRPGHMWWIDLVLLGALIATALWLQKKHKGWHRRVVPVAVAAMMLVSPLIAILYGQGLYLSMTTENATARFSTDPAPYVDPAPNGKRVVWIVFDELDQRLTFEDRPPDVRLPEIDRLRNASLYATRAYSPDAATLRSVPAMTTGRFVEHAQGHGIRDLKLVFYDDDESIEWRDADTVFHRAHAQGRDVGVAGTYHPYCRIFEGLLAKCRFEAHFQETRDFVEMMADHLVVSARVLPGVQMRDVVIRNPADLYEGVPAGLQRREIATYESLHEAGLDMVADPGLDLVFLHYNVPHPTGGKDEGRGFYDPATGTLATGAETSYFDNLLLTDRTLRELRGSMEAADLWNTTTLIISADHGYRYEIWGESRATRGFGDVLHQPTDHRVAFLYKPAGHEGEGIQYDDGFNLIVIADLIMDTFGGHVTTAGDAKTWLDERGTVGPAPFYVVH